MFASVTGVTKMRKHELEEKIQFFCKVLDIYRVITDDVEDYINLPVRKK